MNALDTFVNAISALPARTSGGYTRKVTGTGEKLPANLVLAIRNGLTNGTISTSEDSLSEILPAFTNAGSSIVPPSVARCYPGKPLTQLRSIVSLVRHGNVSESGEITPGVAFFPRREREV